MKCPDCKSNKVVDIPSSTLPIDDRTNTYIGSNIKVPKGTLEIHKSIKHICQDCLNEW